MLEDWNTLKRMFLGKQLNFIHSQPHSTGRKLRPAIQNNIELYLTFQAYDTRMSNNKRKAIILEVRCKRSVKIIINREITKPVNS